MMQPDEVFAALVAGVFLSLELEQRDVHHSVRETCRDSRRRNALEAEGLLVELGRFLFVRYRDRDVPELTFGHSILCSESIDELTLVLAVHGSHQASYIAANESFVVHLTAPLGAAPADCPSDDLLFSQTNKAIPKSKPLASMISHAPCQVGSMSKRPAKMKRQRLNQSSWRKRKPAQPTASRKVPMAEAITARRISPNAPLR